jgi:hypothetical protein
VKSILSKLNVHSKLQAVAFALRQGLLTIDRFKRAGREVRSR